jgi:hypothetical protein
MEKPECRECHSNEHVHKTEGCRCGSCPDWYCINHKPPYEWSEWWYEEEDD